MDTSEEIYIFFMQIRSTEKDINENTKNNSQEKSTLSKSLCKIKKVGGARVYSKRRLMEQIKPDQSIWVFVFIFWVVNLSLCWKWKMVNLM